MPITGQCLCGQVSYTVDADRLLTAVCHCKNCQRQSGSAYSILSIAPRDKLSVEGLLKTYQDTADSGAKLDRQFCPECGSAMFSVHPATPETIIIKAGTFDDTSWLKPVAHVWCSSAQSWVKIDDNVTQFPENAPSG